MRRINIVTLHNGAGLRRNSVILSSILGGAGFSVTVNGRGPSAARPARLEAAYRRLLKRHRYDINLFLEQVVPQWFPQARVNCLIPNQEYFREEAHTYLDRFDLILCKTKCAEEAFGKLGCRTELVGFTSLDRLDPRAERDYDSFLHLAGSSPTKGTRALVELWRRHPEWPRLRVAQHPKYAFPVEAANIEYTAAWLSDATVRELQNKFGVHVCTSEVEAFGHYIVEALSCRAVTVTTDAPPMNEIVTPERGVVVGYGASEVFRLGVKYYVDPAAMERAVNEVSGMSREEKKRLGENAREWYEQNGRLFRRRLVEVLSDL